MTIPADVPRHLGVVGGDQIAFVVTTDGKVELCLPRFTLDSVIGSIEALPNESTDLGRKIEEATAEAVARKMRRILKNNEG